MARLNARSVKSRQNRVLRYVVSTDVDKSASDLGVSTKQLTSFLRAKPETVQKHPERYGKLLKADTQQVAKEKDVKLIQRLSGQRLRKARDYREKERTRKAIKLANATREKYQVTEDGKTTYRPVREDTRKAARQQILTNMGGYDAKSVMDMANRDEITDEEARELLRKLWINSGKTAAQADAYYDAKSA